MCEECGCGEGIIVLNKPVLEANNALAQQINTFCTKKDILIINLMGSPGSGKTTVIEGIAKVIDPKELYVIQGDLESDVDKKRLESAGIDCYQINTHSGCHLNAQMINEALMDSDLSGKNFILIENVGNLVCPADINLGQHMDIVVSSTSEGSDKPKKYPPIFRCASLVIISKTDIADACGFDENRYLEDIGGINPHVVIMKTSSKDQGSIMPIAELLIHKRDHPIGKEHKH